MRRKHEDADLAYMRSLSAAVVQRSPRALILVLLVISLAFSAAIVWMHFAMIDVVVRGSGKVIPSLQLQVVQTLEGGVVSEILVREGDLVDLMQPLLKISDIAFASTFEENRLLYLELKAKIARLEAEAETSEFIPDPEVAKAAPELMRSAQGLYEARRRELDESIQILEEQVSQQRSQLAEAEAKRRQLKRSLGLMREELKLKKPLVARGLVSRVEYLQLQQRENEILGELEGVELSAPRLKSAIEEARRKSEQVRLEFRSKAKRELNEVVAEVSRLEESLSTLEDRVSRTTIRAPMKGTVKRMNINTVGGVIPPNGPILEIVPFEDSLLIEVRIKPSDIANINVRQPARLKFSAYDFAIYGSIEGEVIYLSADTVTNDEGDSFYVARIKPFSDHLGTNERPLPIRVGMTAEADIITAKKSILEYLLKPINRGLRNALQE